MSRIRRFLCIDSSADRKASLQLEAAISYDCHDIFTVVESIYLGLEFIKRTNFDLIVIDVKIPNFELALRELDMSIPTFLSVDFEDSLCIDMKSIKSAGFKGILIKPFSSEYLRSEIKKTLISNDKNPLFSNDNTEYLLKLLNELE